MVRNIIRDNPSPSEREIWDFFYGTDGKTGLPHKKIPRLEMHAHHKRITNRMGSQLLMKTYIRKLLCGFRNGDTSEFNDSRILLKEISIEALEILYQYGSFYEPIVRTKLPYLEPKRQQCSFNSHVLMLAVNTTNKKKNKKKESRALSYVEGIVISTGITPSNKTGTTYPMLHAWNSRWVNSRRALDHTFYASSVWCHYWGIPFTQEEYRHICLLADPTERTSALIFRKRRFNPAVKNYILSILRKRTYIRRRLVRKKEFPKQRFVRKIRLVT